MRLLAVDYGLERMGLAVCDEDETMAFPLRTLRLADYPGRKAQLDALAALIRDERAGGVVIGLPLHGDGAESESSRRARNFCARMRRRVELPFYFMPEYLSTQEAMADLAEAGVPPRRRKAVLDQQAACRILSSFLNLAPEKRLPA